YLYLAHMRQVKLFKRRVGYYPNIAYPTLYHEKVFWRKIFDFNPLFKIFCDKLATKEYIQGRLPDARVAKTIWSIEDSSEIAHLPVTSDMVIKASHGSSFNYFPKGSPDDFNQINLLVRKWLATGYGVDMYETGYFGVKRKVFAEELFVPEGNRPLIDIGIGCANGKAIMLLVTKNCKKDNMQEGNFNLQGERVLNYGESPGVDHSLDLDSRLPSNYKDIIKMAETLSVGIDYARYDFMTDGELIYAGEITVYPGGGHTEATLGNHHGADKYINQFWDIRTSWFLNTPHTGWKSLYVKLLKSSY
ncbi:MAG TPA: ATP-grasp fold amidoligase family protein, partial [Chlorobaculum sp.]|nr:ATP-grasp fold amidoligase family protein [Chlorobaculum sp.]